MGKGIGLADRVSDMYEEFQTKPADEWTLPSESPYAPPRQSVRALPPGARYWPSGEQARRDQIAGSAFEHRAGQDLAGIAMSPGAAAYALPGEVRNTADALSAKDWRGAAAGATGIGLAAMGVLPGIGKFRPATSIARGDVIRWTEPVFGGSFRRPQYQGDRIVTARIRNESYGADKQQHTFTIEVLESTGTQPLQAGAVTTRKGRNIYKNGVERTEWDDEIAREAVLQEKHARGDAARAERDARKKDRY